ncbi:hypothetical protein XHV734_2804 [Xanthomonas hortorum pv. vitians]|nr:hypothetical protein XHV734_2804 [Xanthomonas hortorum pv. vitians]
MLGRKVQDVMGNFVQRGEPLTIRIVVLVDADDLSTSFRKRVASLIGREVCKLDLEAQSLGDANCVNGCRRNVLD